MIHYLHLIGEFWFCSVAKVAEWFLETIFLRNFLSGGGRTMKSKLDGAEEELELGLGSVTFTRGLGRKRVLFSSRVRESLLEIPATESTPVKRQKSRTTNVSLSSERSGLESLPQELLVKAYFTLN